MRVLVACEWSGVVRDAFNDSGHQAVSCDLLETDSPGPHVVGDVLDVFVSGWDLLLAFPPCTYLCSSGLHWNRRVGGRQAKTEKALEFVRAILDAPIDRIALENPVGCISTKIRKPDQIIHPWQFGHGESKTTCLWLKGLPNLKPSKIVQRQYRCACGARFDYSLGKDGCADCCGSSGAAVLRWENQTRSGQNVLGPSPTRAKVRGRTYGGIAQAMAAQWGGAVDSRHDEPHTNVVETMAREASAPQMGLYRDIQRARD